MVIVVLFTLLLLAGILAATLQLGLSSRQNTADQASTLIAQYAAESNISAVRSRFRDYQNLLTTNWTDASGNTITNLQMPSGTQLAAVENDAKAFCGQGVPSIPGWPPMNSQRPANRATRMFSSRHAVCCHRRSDGQLVQHHGGCG